MDSIFQDYVDMKMKDPTFASEWDNPSWWTCTLCNKSLREHVESCDYAWPTEVGDKFYYFPVHNDCFGKAIKIEEIGRW